MPEEPAGAAEDRLAHALASHYPDPPRRIVLGPDGAGAAAVPGIDVYRGADHWRLVTADLGSWPTVTATDPGRAPLEAPGYELSILTPRSSEPPPWAILALVGTVQMCVSVGRWLHPGARLGPGAPIGGPESAIVAWGVRLDDLAAPNVVPAGRRAGAPPTDRTDEDDDGRDLLLLVGVTAGEHQLMQRVGTDLVLDRLLARDGHLRTDPDRR